MALYHCTVFPLLSLLNELHWQVRPCKYLFSLSTVLCEGMISFLFTLLRKYILKFSEYLQTIKFSSHCNHKKSKCLECSVSASLGYSDTTINLLSGCRLPDIFKVLWGLILIFPSREKECCTPLLYAHFLSGLPTSLLAAA